MTNHSTRSPRIPAVIIQGPPSKVCQSLQSKVSMTLINIRYFSDYSLRHRRLGLLVKESFTHHGNCGKMFYLQKESTALISILGSRPNMFNSEHVSQSRTMPDIGQESCRGGRKGPLSMNLCFFLPHSFSVSATLGSLPARSKRLYSVLARRNCLPGSFYRR